MPKLKQALVAFLELSNSFHCLELEADYYASLLVSFVTVKHSLNTSFLSVGRLLGGKNALFFALRDYLCIWVNFFDA
jgi:hypothetical protein